VTECSEGTTRHSSDPGLSRVEVIRSRDRGDPWPGRGYLLPSASKNELRDLLGRLARTTGRDDIWDPEIVVDYAAAHDVLRAGWEIGLGAISAEPNGRANLPELVDLLRAMKSFDDRIRDERLRQRDSAFARAREALAQLRRIDATAALVNEAAVAVCSLGFDRAIVSRIEAGRWVPESVYVGRDARWAQEILAIGREANLLLDESLPETAMARTGTALLISDVQQRTAVNRPVADASLSRSYVAAPIVAHGAVVGFLHADCYYQRRNLDETDRDILAVFGEGLGYALARTAVLDRLDSVRLDLANLAAGVSTAMPAAAWSTDGPAATSTTGDARHGFLTTLLAAGSADSTLTPRETEVLRHLADGDTNARIARRLMVSEGTVKTHVKHILRKLGAANRAEAAARWFQLEHGGGRGPGAARAR
jgi:DNA-binding CsgD family transcriptional regulator